MVLITYDMKHMANQQSEANLNNTILHVKYNLIINDLAILG